MGFNHIELFAGCGGMSLGLEAAGFELYMANELSPMAGETFAFNLLGENLSDLATTGKVSNKVLWINSEYERHNLKTRLKENPFDIVKSKISDLGNDTSLEGKLLIGNIDQLVDFLTKNNGVCQAIKEKNIDLLSGGPPCQGFSLAGKRIKDDYKNILPLSFVKFAELIQPKVVLLENVKGIAAPFLTEDGAKHYTWLEVAKAFSLKGFVPICLLVNSKYFGIPQNRPRFILIAFRSDIFKKLLKRHDNSNLINSVLNKSFLFFQKVIENRSKLNKVTLSDLEIYKIENNLELFDGTLLPKIQSKDKEFLSSVDAIGDITSTTQIYNINKIGNIYSKKLSSIFIPKYPIVFQDLQNHQSRNHSFIVKSRFRLFQVLNNLNGMRIKASKVLTGEDFGDENLREIYESLKEERLLLKDNGSTELGILKDFVHFKNYLYEINSKKHSQRAIIENEPAPAQMTIPDDLCHFSMSELRTLTVREMARLQSFPDWFVFRSKITTGGKLRSSEVPQYTQVGNAVPPLLAYELGKAIKNILLLLE